jgi:hypothetical protein
LKGVCRVVVKDVGVFSKLNVILAELKHEWDNEENHLSSSMNMKINQEIICDVDFEFHTKQWTETSMVVNTIQKDFKM